MPGLKVCPSDGCHVCPCNAKEMARLKKVEEKYNELVKRVENTPAEKLAQKIQDRKLELRELDKEFDELYHDLESAKDTINNLYHKHGSDQGNCPC